MHVIRVAEAGVDAALAEAAAVIRSGGVVIYPTETFYAVGVNALDPEAVKRVFLLKGRAFDMPLSVIIHDKSELSRYVVGLDGLTSGYADRLMPGPVTVVFQAGPCFPDTVTAGTGTIAIRIPLHEIAAGLARAAGVPVTATSANLSGMPGITSPAEAEKVFGGAEILVLDGGETPGGRPTTLVDLTVRPPGILRVGSLSGEAVSNLLGGGPDRR